MHIHRTFWFNFFFLGAMPLFELWNLTKMKNTTETVGQHNSTETAQQNCVKLCSYEGHNFYRKCWFDPFEEQIISPFLSDCPSLMLGIAIHCIQHSQAMLERGVCKLAHSFFHYLLILMPPRSKIEGILFLSCLSFCLSVIPLNSDK